MVNAIGTNTEPLGSDEYAIEIMDFNKLFGRTELGKCLLSKTFIKRNYCNVKA